MENKCIICNKKYLLETVANSCTKEYVCGEHIITITKYLLKNMEKEIREQVEREEAEEQHYSNLADKEQVKEFNLSEWRTKINYNNCRLIGGVWVPEKKIKEFIKMLKTFIKGMPNKEKYIILRKIESLAGKDLI